MCAVCPFSSGNAGNTGNIVYSCGFRAFSMYRMVKEHGEQIAILFALFPRCLGMGDRWKAFIYAVVPPVPSIPPEKHRGGGRIRGVR